MSVCHIDLFLNISNVFLKKTNFGIDLGGNLMGI